MIQQNNKPEKVGTIDYNTFVLHDCANAVIEGTSMLFDRNVSADAIELILPADLVAYLESTQTGILDINQDKGFANIWGFRVKMGFSDMIVVRDSARIHRKYQHAITKTNWEDVDLKDLNL